MLSVLVADRFSLRAPAIHGGMSSIHRAFDTVTGRWVALKLLKVGGLTRRFLREGAVLAELRHDAIVEYVAHGVSSTGDAWLAMEWLEGETLHARLKRRELTIDEVLALARRLAGALACAHVRNVIHRDVKPTNIFLPQGDPALAKLLDFGVARVDDPGGATLTGELVGTMAFMAPEQARGERDLDARADVFALGCVLYRCLARRPAFAGDHPITLLAKILVEEVEPIAAQNPEVSPDLEALVRRMLAKAPGDRPGTAADVLAELEQPAAGTVAEQRAGSLALTHVERRLACVIVAQRAIGLADMDASTAADPSDMATVVRSMLPGESIHVEHVSRDTLLVLVYGTASAFDQAALAVQCGLAIRGALPGVAVAVAMGRGEHGPRATVGEAIASAVRLVTAHGLVSGIGVDDVTARLLERRFQVEETRGGYCLHPAPARGPGRMLQGRLTSLVGRARELGVLRSAFDECVSERVARAVLVIGDAGLGKTRLRTEFVARMLPSSEAQVWVAMADPMRAGSPYAMLSDAIRTSFGLLASDAQDVQRQRLLEQLPPAVASRAAFVGELLGVPFSDEDSAPLRAAREDPTLMSAHVARALEDLVAAESSARPLVVVLEDLHWGDLPTVNLFDNLLRNLEGSSLFIIATARPEVTERFPELWARRAITQLRLGELTPRASEAFVREVLQEAPAAVVERIVDHAGGNPLFLEELLRAALDSRAGERPPDTVMVMLEARLARMPQATRRVLRAASVFGERFWRRGLAALLGTAEDLEVLDHALDEILEHEVAGHSQQRAPRFAGDVEYVFRHALLRDAAYAMLTEPDRVRGHALAARWLEQAGEMDAAVIAGHWEAANDGQAAEWFCRAAEQAIRGNDLTAAVAHAEKGLRRARGELRGRLLLRKAEASGWSAPEACIEEAIALLPRGEPLYLEAQLHRAVMGYMKADLASTCAVATTLLEIETSPSNRRAFVRAGARTAATLFYVGELALADQLRAKVDRVVTALDSLEPADEGRLQNMTAASGIVRGCLGEALRAFLGASDAFARAGAGREAVAQRLNAGWQYAQLGAWDRARELLEDVPGDAERFGLSGLAEHMLVDVYAFFGDLGRARAIAGTAIRGLTAVGGVAYLIETRASLACVLVALGELEDAQAEAHRALEASAQVPNLYYFAHAALARVRLANGDAHGALESAEAAVRHLDRTVAANRRQNLPALVHVEALLALDRTAEATRVIAGHLARISMIANRIGDEGLRRSFLLHASDVPELVRLGSALGVAAP